MRVISGLVPALTGINAKGYIISPSTYKSCLIDSIMCNKSASRAKNSGDRPMAIITLLFNHLAGGRERAGCLTSIVFLLACGY